MRTGSRTSDWTNRSKKSRTCGSKARGRANSESSRRKMTIWADKWRKDRTKGLKCREQNLSMELCEDFLH